MTFFIKNLLIAETRMLTKHQDGKIFENQRTSEKRKCQNNPNSKTIRPVV